MSTTTTVALPANEWTAVSSGSASVTVQGFISGTNTPASFRVAVSSSAPDDDTSGLMVTPADQGFQGLGLANTDNVYAYPYQALVAEVIAS